MQGTQALSATASEELTAVKSHRGQLEAGGAPRGVTNLRPEATGDTLTPTCSSSMREEALPKCLRMTALWDVGRGWDLGSLLMVSQVLLWSHSPMGRTLP